jgi:hypothetical protein
MSPEAVRFIIDFEGIVPELMKKMLQEDLFKGQKFPSDY